MGTSRPSPPSPHAKGLLETQIEERLRALADEIEALERRLRILRGRRPRLVLDEGKATVRLTGGPPISLAKRHALRRVLFALVRARESGHTGALPWSALLVEGWPRERVRVSAGFARVRSAIYALRRLGLGDAITTMEDGYALASDVEIIRRGGEFHALSRASNCCELYTAVVRRRETE